MNKTAFFRKVGIATVKAPETKEEVIILFDLIESFISSESTLKQMI